MTNPLETAKVLLDQQAEINRLKAKLHRAKEYVTHYSKASGTTSQNESMRALAAGVIDIIDNAYEPDKKETT